MFQDTVFLSFPHYVAKTLLALGHIHMQTGGKEYNLQIFLAEVIKSFEGCK